jgi:hypothetical protein
MRMAILTKIGKCMAFALLASGALAGAVCGTGLAREPETPPAQKKSDPPMAPMAAARQKDPTAEPEVRRDQFDDPLPKGAVARLGSSRFRHGGNPFASAAFSADGRQVASAHGPIRGLSDSLAGVEVFDVATGRLLQHIRLPDGFHHLDIVVRFLGDGKRIAVAGADSPKTAELIVYDLADGKASAHSKFQSVKDQIFVIDVNADASQVLVEDRFAKVFLWDVKAKREVWSFEQPALSFSLPFADLGSNLTRSGPKTSRRG